jgi:hypothetical protein
MRQATTDLSGRGSPGTAAHWKTPPGEFDEHVPHPAILSFNNLPLLQKQPGYMPTLSILELIARRPPRSGQDADPYLVFH